MTNSYLLNVGKQFSRFPAGRYRSDGPASGEKFRDEVLIPLLKAHDLVTIELDDTLGYGSSFLEEAFGGAVRAGVAAADLGRKIELVTEDASLGREIRDYIVDAGRV